MTEVVLMSERWSRRGLNMSH